MATGCMPMFLNLMLKLCQEVKFHGKVFCGCYSIIRWMLHRQDIWNCQMIDSIVICAPTMPMHESSFIDDIVKILQLAQRL